jgi:uncharacterized protein (UPF0303 family)
VDEKDYATHGGSFPLTIKNVGVVGTITVSGLAQEVTSVNVYVVKPKITYLFTILG